ncbi:HPr family phosphocarrier protein, partial [Streptomyces hygroscopicus]
MPQRIVAIGSRSGLHARPATVFVQTAAKQPVKVT